MPSIRHQGISPRPPGVSPRPGSPRGEPRMMKKLTLGKKNSTALMKSPSFLQRMLLKDEDSEDCSDLDSDASAAMSSRGLDSDSSVGTSARGSVQGSVRGSVKGSLRGSVRGRKKKKKEKKMIVKTTMDIDVRNKELSAWFKELGAILPTDGLIMALDAMYHTKQSRAFVVTDKGKPIGVITLEDVCKELIRLEELEKEECHLSMLNANHHYY